MKSKRLLELMQRVQSRPKFTVQELADEFKVSYSTMWRYLQELSELGVPLYSDVGAAGGYRVLQGQKSPTTRPVSRQPDTPDAAASRPVEGTIVELPAIRIVGLDVTCPYGAWAEVGVLIPRLWLQIISRLAEIPHLVDGKTRLSASDNRESEFQVWLGFEVGELGNLPDGMVSKTVPARRYARFTHYGSLESEAVHATYHAAYRWIEAHGYRRPAGALNIERFDERFRTLSTTCAYDIYLPVNPLQ